MRQTERMCGTILLPGRIPVSSALPRSSNQSIDQWSPILLSRGAGVSKQELYLCHALSTYTRIRWKVGNYVNIVNDIQVGDTYINR